MNYLNTHLSFFRNQEFCLLSTEQMENWTVNLPHAYAIKLTKHKALNITQRRSGLWWNLITVFSNILENLTAITLATQNLVVEKKYKKLIS